MEKNHPKNTKELREQKRRSDLSMIKKDAKMTLTSGGMTEIMEVQTILKDSQAEERSKQLNILDIPVNYLPFPGEMTLSEYEELVTYFVQKWRNDRANYLHIEEASPRLQPFTENL